MTNGDGRLWTHFDKLLLAVLFVVVTGLTFWIMHKFPDSESLHWIENADGQILAALLTMMVGQRMIQRKPDDTNGKAPVPPTVPTP